MSQYIKYYLYSAEMPPFGAVSRDDMDGYPPSPSVFKVVSGVVEDKHCILKTNESGKIVYKLMKRSSNKWSEARTKSTPLSEELARIRNGWRVPVAGRLTYTARAGLRIDNGQRQD